MSNTQNIKTDFIIISAGTKCKQSKFNKNVINISISKKVYNLVDKIEKANCLTEHYYSSLFNTEFKGQRYYYLKFYSFDEVPEQFLLMKDTKFKVQELNRKGIINMNWIKKVERTCIVEFDL